MALQFFLPYFAFYTLYEDSEYWKAMSNNFVTHGLNVKLLQGSVQRLTHDDFSQLEQVISLSIETIPVEEIEFEGKVGVGSHASVIRGRFGDEDIVLKRLEFVNVSAANILSFCREAFLSNKLQHPNVVRFHGVTMHAPDLYLVYEHCNLGSLFKVLISQALSWEKKLLLALGGARGLDFLHQNQIIHRDVNNNNLLVTQLADGSMQVKVCDFGTARKVVGSNPGGPMSIPAAKLSPLFSDTVSMDFYALTVKGIGTLAYLAPELLKFIEITDGGAPRTRKSVHAATYDFKVDVYSFGMVLWEIASQRRVFEDIRSCQKYQDMVLAGHRPSLKEFKGDFGKLVAQCWHPKPKRRPTFAEIVMRLSCILSESIRFEKLDSPKADPSFSDDYLLDAVERNPMSTKDLSSV